MHKVFGRLAWVAGSLFLVALILGLGALSRGTQAMSDSDAAFSRGQLGAALDHALIASQAYVPWAPHVQAAEARLRALALGAEATGQAYLAQRAWSALRASRVQTAHPWTHLTDPSDTALLDANTALPRLLPTARAALGDEAIETETSQASLAEVYSRNALPQVPILVSHSLGMLLLLAAGALACYQNRLPKVWIAAGGGLGLAFWLFAALGA